MKKLKKENIAIIVVIFLIMVYIAIQFYSVTHIKLETQTATLSTVYESIDCTALVVRDEHAVANTSSLVTVPCNDDGAKINKDGNICMVFSSADKAKTYTEYLNIQNQLQYYENLRSQTVGVAVSVQSMNEEIGENVNNYIRSINSGNVKSVDANASAINESLIRRQLIIGEKIDFSSIIDELSQKSSSLSNSVASPDSYITTDTSGVYSSYTDGYENLVSGDKLPDITVKQLKSYIEQTKKPAKSTNNVGKIVTNYNVYFAAVVKAKDAKKIADSKNEIQISFEDNSDITVSADVVDTNYSSTNDEDVVLILHSSEMNNETINQRCENIKIIYNSCTGIKMPKSAVHTVKGKKGVYALIASEIEFRQADILYTTDDDYVVLSFDKDKANGIRIYDKIITQGKDLEDGKVYT